MKTFEETYTKQKEDFIELCGYRLAKEVYNLFKDENLEFTMQSTKDYIGFQNDEVTFLAIRNTQKKLVIDIRVSEGQTKLCGYPVRSYDSNSRIAHYDFVPGIADLQGFRVILLEAYRTKRR
ncbi:hypothetical protein ES703_10939 [subsurface metagenome]